MPGSKSACAICLENQSIHVKCPHCKDGTYCKSCITKLIKENNHEKCPICRRDGWYERETKMHSLITKHHATTHANDAHESESTVCKALTKILVYSIVLSMVTFVGWVALFVIYGYRISTTYSNYYIVTLKIMMSLSAGLGVLLTLSAIKNGGIKLYEYCKVNCICNNCICNNCICNNCMCNNCICNNCICNNCDCLTLQMSIFMTSLLTLLGYYLAFILFELKIKPTDNNIANNIIIFIISFLSGTVACAALAVAFGVYQLLYQYCKKKTNGNGLELCCEPLFIMVFIIFTILMTTLGIMVTFGIFNVKLNVNREHEEIIKIIIGFLVGYGIILTPVILCQLCKGASQLCKGASQLCKGVSQLQLCNNQDAEILDISIHGEESL